MGGARTTLRPATAADAAMLAAWHADPEVSRFWDDETFTEDELLERLRREDVEAWIVEADGEPVGYLQSWWEEGPGPRRGGLDLFLVPPARGRGLGPDAGRALALHLLGERGWAEVTVDPYLGNEPAIRAWRRAGFRDRSRHEPDADHREPWVLMVFEPLG